VNPEDERKILKREIEKMESEMGIKGMYSEVPDASLWPEWPSTAVYSETSFETNSLLDRGCSDKAGGFQLSRKNGLTIIQVLVCK